MSSVEVWGVELATIDFQRLACLLHSDELARARRFQAQRDADQYVAAHAAVRLVLGSELGCPPERVIFDTTCRHCGAAHGKPAVVGFDRDFSMARRNGIVLIALATTKDVTVGADVEVLSSTAAQAIYGTVLSNSERAQLEAIAPEERAPALLRAWTRKEAVLKATGYGLAVSPEEVVVGVAAEPASVSVAGPAGDGRRWHVHDLDVGDGFVGSVATDDCGAQIRISRMGLDQLEI